MRKKFTPTPHDTVFKKFLSDKEVARDLFSVWLPEEIKKLCQLDSLKLEAGSFIDSDMKNYQSDILYSIKTTKGHGYLYSLIEHQSKPDKLIAWRIMRYSMAVMQQHLEQGHKTLPLVFPMLFYCGKKSPYPYSTNWLDCFQDKKLAEHIYTHPFRLADVTTLDDGEIMQHRRIAILELLQKHIRQRDMSELLNKIVKLLSYGYHTDEQVITLMNYLIQEGNAKNSMQFIMDIAKQSEKHEEALMTIAQQIEQMGVAKGIQQGIQQGIQEGKKEASLEMARKMLEAGVERQSVIKFTGLTATQLSELFNG